MKERELKERLFLAMKSRDEVSINYYREIMTKAKNFSIMDKSNEITEDHIMKAFKKEYKEAKQSFDSNNSEYNKRYLELAENNMPKMLTEEDIGKIVDELINQGLINTGQIMREIMSKYKNVVDGKVANRIISARIGGKK